MYAAEITIRTVFRAGTAKSVAVIPVATATRTIVVPTMIPARYARERRTPWAEPAAVRLIVAGPGLPMIASDVTTSGPADPQWIVATRSGSGIAAPIPWTHAGDAMQRRCRWS